jgi:Arabinose efflux permease
MKNAWAFVPSLYFAEGLPYIIINSLAVMVYSSLNVKNDIVAFWTSCLYLPWILKMFWAPIVDSKSTKRKWILMMQVLLAVVFLFIALSFSMPNYLVYSLAGFFAGAFISATHDIAIDGYYMLALNEKGQSFFVGIRTLFYRLAMIYGSGIIAIFAGTIKEQTGDIFLSWKIAFMTIGALFLLFYLWHSFISPKPANDKPVKTDNRSHSDFDESFKSYFTQKNIIAILAFILLYRLGEASLEKITTPFLMNPIDEGALGISLKVVGVIKGTYAMIALIIGNILGGFLLAKYGFKKCIWPFALALTLPNIVYLYMAYFRPSLSTIAVLLCFEQFGYGLGFMAFTVFVMLICSGKYKTSHYAISTGIMALGMMVPGMLSGKIQMELGYKNFYWLVLILSIPGLLTIPYILKTPCLNNVKLKEEEN